MVLRKKVYDQILPQLPKKWVSHYFGQAAHKALPEKLSQTLIKAYIKLYDIDPSEAEKDLQEYKSVGDFFSRALKQGARPIEGDLIHPCDGRLIQSGNIFEGTLIQAKGKSYKLNEFVPENPWPDAFEGVTFLTYYLAPHNYHRVHTPLESEVSWVQVVPGELWPVNGWSVKRVDRLYAVNERVAVGLKTEKGQAILVMVGATNVGSMSFSFDSRIRTNQRPRMESYLKSYEEPHALSVGEELGTFHMGSTVVLLLDKNHKLSFQDKKDVQMGQPI